MNSSSDIESHHSELRRTSNTSGSVRKMTDTWLMNSSAFASISSARYRAGRRSARRVADTSREVTDQEHHGMTGVLHLPHHPEVDAVTEMQERRRDVHAVLDAKLAAGAGFPLNSASVTISSVVRVRSPGDLGSCPAWWSSLGAGGEVPERCCDLADETGHRLEPLRPAFTKCAVREDELVHTEAVVSP